MLVEVEPYAEQVAGRLWWKRWDRRRDMLWLWAVVDGTFSVALIPDDAADAELRKYDAGVFGHDGERLSVVWTDEEESRLLRSTAFGREVRHR